MIVSIMQPYFFPYMGYFQLMSACDAFVVFDDAQYIRRGWVNRNRILINGEPQWITFPVNYGDHRWPINRREYLLSDGTSQPQKLLRRISGAYQAAPYFAETMALVSEILSFPDANVAAFNVNLLRKVANFIGIKTPFLIASELDKDNTLSGQDIVTDICTRLGARRYVNPIGGLPLYDPAFFAARQIELRFLSSCAPEYAQFGKPHHPSLSIIDVLMFNGAGGAAAMLPHYRLVTKDASPAPASTEALPS